MINLNRFFKKLNKEIAESTFNRTHLDIIKQKIKNVPDNSGVYRMLNEKGVVLYVGKAKNLKKRLLSYTHVENLSLRIKKMLEQTNDIEIIVTENETSALILENDLIKKLSPRYNILLKDDKTFPFILINKEHDYPKITKHRGKQVAKGIYFGPFATIGAVNQTITILQKAFLLRSCSDSSFANRSKPCLLYQIKRCSAPCVNKVTLAEYTKLVFDAQNFLSGKNKNLQKDLSIKMHQASNELAFENASIFRDRIKALNLIQSQNRLGKNPKDADVIGVTSKNQLSCVEVFFFRAESNCGNHSFFPEQTTGFANEEILEAFLKQFYADRTPPAEIVLSHNLPDKNDYEKYFSAQKESKVTISTPTKGFKKTLVQNVVKNAEIALNRKAAENTLKNNIFEQIAIVFNLKEKPKRIEFYDNSHLGGTNAVGAMVPANHLGIIHKEKRKFYIKNHLATSNDTAMLKEVITRRFSQKNIPANYPDVIFVDGGKAQLNAAVSTLEALKISNITVIGAVKNQQHEYKKFILSSKKEIILDSFDSAFHFLQFLGQEVHNFALGVMTKRKKKNTFHSSIDDIKGIGKVRRKALIEHFGSIKCIANASINDLIKIPQINKKIADLIYKHFH